MGLSGRAMQRCDVSDVEAFLPRPERPIQAHVTLREDIHLIDDMRAGRNAEGAFAELYDRYADRVHAYCRRALGQGHPFLHDVVQNVFVGLYDAIRRGTVFTSVAGYIFRAARHACISAIQRRHADYAEMDLMASHDTSYERKELLRLIDAALEQLPEDYREIFLLREQMGLKYNEIAEALSITPETARTRAYRARMMVRDVLSPYLRDLELNEGHHHGST